MPSFARLARRAPRLLFAAVLAVGALHTAVAPAAALQAQGAASSLPTRLSDAEFWKLERDISEPGGYFRIEDNYTSNESEVARVFTGLRQRGVFGGVYLGVGPEQNFSYIAATRPQMVFICDIRRQAIMQHLMYKAVFELSKDRADFLSLLFSKPRPAGLDTAATAQKLWDAYWYVSTDTVIGPRNYQRIVDHLTKTKGFTFDDDERAKLRAVWEAFYYWGPTITTTPTQNTNANNRALTFADLTGYQTDDAGVVQSFLSTEAHYRIIKDLHDRNLIVPVSGDFGGAKALRAIGAYIKEKNATVNAFYVSNVEQYLFTDGKDRAFYANVATLPVTEASVFIRPYSLRRGGGGGAVALCPIAAYLRAVNAGRVYSNNDANACVRG